MPSPDWLPVADFYAKVAIAVTTATLTAVFGCIATWIALRQARTAKDKLKLDLFDRRYAVYLALTQWISDLQGRVVPDEEYAAHIRKIEPIQVLFDDDVKDWFKELRQKARAMNHARRVCDEARQAGPDSSRHAAIAEASKNYGVLTMDFDKELDRSAAMFSRYLDFSKNL